MSFDEVSRLEQAIDLAEMSHNVSLDGVRAAIERHVAEAVRERDEARVSVDTLRAAIKMAEAALADIGDSDHEPPDDLAWCERRAQQSLPVVRFALAATEAKP